MSLWVGVSWGSHSSIPIDDVDNKGSVRNYCLAKSAYSKNVEDSFSCQIIQEVNGSGNWIPIGSKLFFGK